MQYDDYSTGYDPKFDFLRLSKYSVYDKYKGVNIILREGEDLAYLTFGNFFRLKGVEVEGKGFALPRNTTVVGSVWIPVPEYSYDTKKISLKTLPDFYKTAITTLVNSYLNDHLQLCISLGIVQVEMDPRMFQFYKDSENATLKTFVDISTITREERMILRDCYNHQWSFKERNDFKPDGSALYNLINGNRNQDEIVKIGTKSLYFFDEDDSMGDKDGV